MNTKHLSIEHIDRALSVFLPGLPRLEPYSAIQRKYMRSAIESLPEPPPDPQPEESDETAL